MLRFYDSIFDSFHRLGFQIFTMYYQQLLSAISCLAAIAASSPLPGEFHLPLMQDTQILTYGGKREQPNSL